MSRSKQNACACEQMWADVSQLEITESPSASAPLQIGFYKGDHGDGWPFDGRGQIIGHVWPMYTGQVHFDNDENWTDGTWMGTLRGVYTALGVD